MRIPFLLAGLIAVVAAAGSGCGGVEMDSKVPRNTEGNQVATGTVEMGEGIVLPPDAAVAVRVVDVAHRGRVNPNAAALGQVSSTQAVTLPPEVIGEQRIQHPVGTSIPFAVRFNASEEQLQGGLVLEARVSVGGAVKYYNVESYAVDSANLSNPRRIDVNGVR